MYQVLLADDEVIFRECVQANIRWEELGFELVGLCKDGREAQELIRHRAPDLLITDICMPYVDGIELTRFVYENYPQVKSIILSGYDEFEYAKQAISCQVMEYILKPVTAHELSDTLLRIRKILDYENHKIGQIKQIRSEYLNGRRILRTKFLNRLVTEQLDGQDIRKQMEKYGIYLNGNCYLLAMIEEKDETSFRSSPFYDKKDLGYFAILNIAEEVLEREENALAFQMRNGSIGLLFGAAMQPELQLKAKRICNELERSIRNYLNIQVILYIGKMVPVLEELTASEQSIRRMEEYSYLYSNKTIYQACDLDINSQERLFNINRWKDGLVRVIQDGQEGELDKLIREFADELRKRKPAKKECLLHVQNMMLSLIGFLQDLKVEQPELFRRLQMIQIAIYEDKTLRTMKQHLAEACHEASDALRLEREGCYQHQVKMALNYIENHYDDPEMNLHDICAHLAVSISHFSFMFKCYTGETFIEALTKKRIEKAKALMENTSLKIYEISQAVGYDNAQYFSSTFRKITGCSPREYIRERRH